MRLGGFWGDVGLGRWVCGCGSVGLWVGVGLSRPKKNLQRGWVLPAALPLQRGIHSARRILR